MKRVITEFEALREEAHNAFEQLDLDDAFI